jgi:hypothetical protein
LFNVTLAYVISKVSKNSEGIRWGLWGKLTDLNYADDIRLLTHSTRTMQTMLERLEKESAKVGLKINIKKSKEMRIALNNKEPLYIHNEIIERVTQFTCLGNIIDNTGSTEADITAHIRKAQIAFSALNKIWHSTAYSVQTKLHIFNTNMKAYLLYGCETWKNSKSLTAKLQVFINKCLRKILRIFWPDQIMNNESWKFMKQPRIDLQIRKRKGDSWAMHYGNHQTT